MTAKHFVDTNVLVYGFDESDSAKRARSQQVMRRLWDTRRGRLSLQVLQEFYVTVTRKLEPPLPKAKARDEVNDLFGWNPVPPSAALFKSAWEIEDRFGLSWWDSLVAAAAKQAGCSTLLTEDLQDGLDLGGLLVANPFAEGFDPEAALG